MDKRYCCRIALCVLLCALAVPALAQPSPVEIPDTPAGKLLVRLVEAFNSGEENQWRDFIENHWKEREGAFEGRLGFFEQVYCREGQLRRRRGARSPEDRTTSCTLSQVPHGTVVSRKALGGLSLIGLVGRAGAH
jgi:hypothetical protein